MGKAIPDRWLNYRPLGQPIYGTPIVAFKVPLRLEVCQRRLPEHEWFTPTMLLQNYPHIKTVVDLTNTDRYYNGQEEFGTKGIDHVKILVEGKGKIPPPFQIQRFFAAMEEHMRKYGGNTGALVGVHCTHGLNRTGYFVCRWMIDCLNMEPNAAIACFNRARGHDMERIPLLNQLRLQRSSLPAAPNFTRNHYYSPLDDPSYDEVPRNSRYRSGRTGNHYSGTVPSTSRYGQH